jgi:transposase
VAEQLPEVEILLKRLSSLEAQIVRLQAEVADLRAANTRLQAENARLEHRVEASVGTEQPEQPQATQQRRVSEEANLAQRQEATRRTAWAHGLQAVEKPDQVQVHLPERCAMCGRVISAHESHEVVGKRQVFDVPGPRLAVTEHRLGEITC